MLPPVAGPIGDAPVFVPCMRHCADAVVALVGVTDTSSNCRSGNAVTTAATLAASASPLSGPPVVGSS
jgi:hypothetical protein